VVVNPGTYAEQSSYLAMDLDGASEIVESWEKYGSSD